MPDVARRDAAVTLESLLRPMRAALANLRAAAETLDALPDLEIERRSRLLSVLVDESQRLTGALDGLERRLREQRPEAPAATAAAAVAIVAATIADSGLRCERPAPAVEPDGEITVPLDGLAAGVAELARVLRRDLGVSALHLEHRLVERFVRLDIGWRLRESASEESAALALDAIAGDGSGSGLRTLLRRAGGEAWLAVARDGSGADLRLLLPLAERPEES